MKRLVYRSTSNLSANDVGMLDIIRACDRDNEPAEITGMLWFDGQFFLQAIEGPDAAVNALFLKLRRDTRHRSLFVMDVQPIETRRYNDFGVQFRRGLRVIDPVACGITHTVIGPTFRTDNEARARHDYTASIGQAAALPD